MRTARSSSRWGGSSPGTPPGTRHPPGADPPEQTHPQDQASPGTRHHPPPWTEFLTHAYENITLPQTSFAGGKHDIFKKLKLYDTKKSHRCSKQESIPVGCVLPLTPCKPPDVASGDSSSEQVWTGLQCWPPDVTLWVLKWISLKRGSRGWPGLRCH